MFLAPGFDEVSLPISVMTMTKALLVFAGRGPNISFDGMSRAETKG